MPEIREAPQVQDVDLESAALITALEGMKDAYALSLVQKTFYHYDSLRQQNHDARWQTSDALYLGWMPKKTWDGTSIPRASLPMPLVFDQIESVLPTIMQEIFDKNPEWFQVEATAQGDPQAAQATQAAMVHGLDQNQTNFGLSLRNDVEIAAKDMLTYGNGGLAIEWDTAQQIPLISWVSIRDVYFDPAATVPAVDYCRSVIRRSMKSVEEILDWKNTPGMNIPSKEVLWGMANASQHSAGDQGRQIQSAILGYSGNVAENLIPLPADRQIEVLTYSSKSRIIIVLNREWVAFVSPNIYGFIPFAFAPCYIVPGKFYAMSIADVQEGNQRYIEALMNARLDEIHLSLHPPRVQKASSLLTPAQQKWAPGRVFKAADPKNDFVALSPAGVTTNISEEVNFIEIKAEKRTGINSMGQGGVPRPSNANRTASGMQMQAAGGSSRIQLLVKHIEDYMLVPMLYKIHKMMQIHLTQDGTVPGRRSDGQAVEVNTAAFRKPVTFKILASSQMLTREKLANIFPFILQYLANGPFISGLASSGMTLNWQMMFTFLQDATGIGRLYELVRPMSDEEKQQQSQPPPEVMMQAQQAQQEQETQLKIAADKNQTDLQKAQMAKAPNPAEQQAEQAKLEMDMQRAQMKLEMDQQKMAMEQQKMEMTLQMKRMEMQLKGQEQQMNMILGEAQAKQDFELESQKTQMASEAAQQEHALGMQQSQEQAKLATEQGQAKHQQVIAQTKEKQALRPTPGKQAATKARQPKPK